jgi:sigma-B regulation protein RsbU (phosphoserine phosphatase)
VNDDRAARLGMWIAVGWLIAMVVVNLLAPPSLVTDPLLPLAPLAACAVLTTRATAGFAVAAVALSVVSGVWNENWDTPQQWLRFFAVLLISGGAVVIAEVRIRREHQFERLSHIADAAQRAILPILPTSASGVNVAARYRPAAEDTLVGGDLYDCSLTNDRVRFLIGDFRGKGIEAIGHAARVIRAFRQSAAYLAAPDDVVRDMDAYLTPFFGEEDFATALLVDVSHRGRISIANCGHPPPLLIRPDGTGELLDLAPGLPLGLGAASDSVTLPWGPGDRLLLYTDGLSEARDASGNFPSLPALVASVATDPIEHAVDGLLERVRAHVPGGELVDDAAVLLLENRQGGAAAPDSRPAAHGARQS